MLKRKKIIYFNAGDGYERMADLRGYGHVECDYTSMTDRRGVLLVLHNLRAHCV